jgi:hypothetical protein
MTWSLINQLVVESRITRSALRGRARCNVQDVAVLSGLVSLKGHRVFGYGTNCESVDGAGSMGSLKSEPLGVQDYCSVFVLPGSQTKMSDVAFVRPARQLFASLGDFNFVQVLTGSFFFFIGSLQTVQAFGSAFLKTRGLLILRLRIYNQARRRAYLVSVSHFLLFWRFNTVAGLRSVVLGGFTIVGLVLAFLRGWFLFFCLRVLS